MGSHTRKKQPRYFTIDMGGVKKYFNTKKEADEWRKFINEKTSMWLKLYKV